MPANSRPTVSLPDGPVTLDNVTLPGPLVGQDEALDQTSLSIENGVFSGNGPGSNRIDLGGRMVLPAFTDMHTHLDKGHIWPRKPNPDGTFAGALSSVGEDREANWSAEDVRARMNFALECAYAYGTRAIRTHLDSIPPQDDISWGVFKEVRSDWKDRIDLQAVSLVGAEGIEADGAGHHPHTVDLVGEAGGILGFVPYPLPDIAERIETYFRTAAERGLEADLHVD
ncbi:MAG: amidohydrolase family protein, partial [Cohaesibacteraceae bacterium]